MKKFFLFSLLTLMCSVMAWADNIAQITVGEAAPVGYETLEALQEAIAALPTDGTVATIKLLTDIDGGELSANQNVIVIPANAKAALDLNGFTLSAQLKLTVLADKLATHVIKNEGELTVNDSGSNGTIKNSFANANKTNSNQDCISVIGNEAGATLTLNKCIINNGAMGIDNYGTLIINDGVRIDVNEGTYSTLVDLHYGYNNGGNAICARSESQTTINGGFIKSHNFNAIQVNKTAILAVKGGELTGVAGYGWIEALMNNKSQVTISGGNFDADPSEYVDQDHYADLVDGRYIVKDLPDPIIATVTTYEEFKEKLNLSSNVQTVELTLGGDIVVSEPVTLKHGSSLTIPAGRTLTIQDGGLLVNDGRTINNGSITTVGSGFFSKPASVEGEGTINISGYSITVEDNVVTYPISNGMQLQYLSYLASLTEYQDKTWNISLTTDITLPTAANFEPIYAIEGTFEGNGHAINNLTILSSTSYAALILYFKGDFQNVVMNNVNISTSSLASGLFIVAYNNSVIKNVKMKGSITSTGSYAVAFNASRSTSEAYSKMWYVNCENNATITSSQSFAGVFFGTLSGSTGNIGYYNCTNTGNVSGVYAGVLGAYGAGAALELIAFTNTGTITASNNKGATKIDGVNFVGAGSATLRKDSIDATKYTAIYDERIINGVLVKKYFAVEAGTIDNTNATTTDWATNTTWTEEDNTQNVVPTEADNVTVNSTVVVSDGTEAEAKSVTVSADQKLTIEEGGSLEIGEGGLEIKAGATVTVEQGATLVVGKDGITGDGVLVVEATEDGGTGVVLVDPAAKVEDSRPIVSVELIPDAHKVSEGYYLHRYIGIPLYFEGEEVFTSANWEREALQDGESVATIAKTWSDGAWKDVTSISEFVPFKGYALSNESDHGVKYTFTGKMIGNGDGTMNFKYGFNLFANSYTAPINIQTLLNGLSDDVKATIYMFKDNKLLTVSKADFAGYRTPKFEVIPSLQAFFVLLDDGTSASETVDYEKAVFNNSLPNSGLYAPKRQEAPAFNRVRINIAAENGASDEVYLIEAAEYTNEFENGFDEVKYMNNGLNLYATTAYGRQSTEITNDLNGTFIGVQGNGTYTMTFDELVGEEYQIRDLQTDAVITMSEENTYTFVANGTDDARFVVTPKANMPTALDNIGEAKMFIHDNTLFIPENNSNANIMIYAANGQLVLTAVAQPTVSLNGLANGVYTVRVANQTLKFVK